LINRSFGVNEKLPAIYLARHGETAWSLSGHLEDVGASHGTVEVLGERHLPRIIRAFVLPQFSRKTGLPVSSLYRLERGEQSVTLSKLDQLLKQLKCSTADVFRSQARPSNISLTTRPADQR